MTNSKNKLLHWEKSWIIHQTSIWNSLEGKYHILVLVVEESDCWLLVLSRYRTIPEPLKLLCDNFMKSFSEEFFPIWVTLKFWRIISCRLESLFRYVHNGTPVLSHAESKMKKELEDIKTFLQFHRESLEQVQSVILTNLMCDLFGCSCLRKERAVCQLLLKEFCLFGHCIHLQLVLQCVQSVFRILYCKICELHGQQGLILWQLIGSFLLQIKAKNEYSKKSPRKSTSSKLLVVNVSQQNNIRQVLSEE